MGILGGMARRIEQRSSLENPRVPLSDAKAWAAVFGAMDAASGIDVTPDKALGVPAVWCAVNFIANTFAALPAPVFRKTETGREKDERNPVYILLHDWVNDDYLTSFAWRKQAMVDTLLTGRSYTFVEGKRSGRITNLWPLNPFNVTVERVNGQRRYKYRNGEKQFVYGVDEIIDVPFMVGFDKLSSVNPTSVLRDTLGLCIALERYASRFFRNGGVPPLAMQMPSGASAGAARRGAANIEELIQSANDGSGLVLPMPEGHRLEAVGFEPAKGQLTEARLYQIREIARIYGLPPIFLQDLQFGTYSNTEQQDLMLVKHTLTQWLVCWEQELNAKLFGPRSKNYIRFNQDGLLRGDYTTRMTGHAQAVQNGIKTPDECRELEDMAPKGGLADKLFIQGATVPLGMQPVFAKPQEPPPADQQ